MQHDDLNGRLVFLKVNFESGLYFEATFVRRSGLAMICSLTSQRFTMCDTVVMNIGGHLMATRFVYNDGHRNR